MSACAAEQVGAGTVTDHILQQLLLDMRLQTGNILINGFCVRIPALEEDSAVLRKKMLHGCQGITDKAPPLLFRIKGPEGGTGHLTQQMTFLIAQIVGSGTKEGILHIDDFQIFLIHEDIGSMEVTMEQHFCLAHEQIPELVPLQNHPGIKYQIPDIVCIVRIQLKTHFSGAVHIPVAEGHVVKDRTHFAVHEPNLQLPEGVCIQIIIRSIEMDLCQIFRNLTGHLGEHDGLVQLEPGNLQMGNIFHRKDQIFIIIKVQLRQILGHNDMTKFHVVIFQSGPVHGHIVKISNTSVFSGLLQD